MILRSDRRQTLIHHRPSGTRAATRVLAGAVAAVVCLSSVGVPVANAQPARNKPQAPAPAATPAAPRNGGDEIALNFKDADIDSVVGAFGHLLNRTFVIDPRVRGKITLETPRPVPKEQALQMLGATLRMQGFVIVEAGPIAKVIPEGDAKLQAGPVTASRQPPTGGAEQLVTQIFRLNYESATNLVPVLRPLIAPNNTITAYAANNSLVITDYASNLGRIARIIATLDAPSSSEVEVIAIKHAVATDIAVGLNRLLDDTGRAGAPGAAVDPGQRVTVLADPRINSVLIRSPSPSKIALARTLVARLDQPSTQPGNINVVYLRNAEAVRLAQVLRGVLAGGQGGTTGIPGTDPSQSGFGQQQQGFGQTQQTGLGQQGSAGGQFGQQSPANTPLGGTGQQQQGTVTFQAGGAVIAADPSTNSLIITAPDPVYRNIRAVIDKLDARRAQVFIESLIVEVSAERAAELGLQWQFLSSGGGGSQVIGGTNLPQRGSGTNILDATTAAGLLGVAQGLNIGLVRSGTVVGADGTTQLINLGLLARALETSASANILATPNLVTLDNEEARIIIGQNIPILTGSFSSLATAGGATANPFQTFERRDVGTTLRVRPQISESGTVTMRIFQEVSNVQQQTTQGIITNRRAIESNVLVDDGQILVLGGLIEERTEGGVQKVPGLGDIPVVGQLFRYDNRRRVKTNLLVFLRPVVVRNAETAHSVTADRYDYMRQVQGDSTQPKHWALPDLPSSPLPPMPSKPLPRLPGGREGDLQNAPAIDVPRGQPALEAPRSQPDLPGSPAQSWSRAPQADPSRNTAAVQTAPNEVVVPLGGGAQVQPVPDPSAQPVAPAGGESFWGASEAEPTQPRPPAMRMR